eukprot:TRINITY_DN90861_c0_g1_i1.p1 TRINITY_DN90861_c0_g1~~TRINITY_DN90861_c0_g1_i1.p1  ORF type:complete len:476 (-),score=77.97 TRINITY_DN90861_c0_g1_i1:139-1527(-)
MLLRPGAALLLVLLGSRCCKGGDSCTRNNADTRSASLIQADRQMSRISLDEHRAGNMTFSWQALGLAHASPRSAAANGASEVAPLPVRTSGAVEDALSLLESSGAAAMVASATSSNVNIIMTLFGILLASLMLACWAAGAASSTQAVKPSMPESPHGDLPKCVRFLLDAGSPSSNQQPLPDADRGQLSKPRGSCRPQLLRRTLMTHGSSEGSQPLLGRATTAPATPPSATGAGVSLRMASTSPGQPSLRRTATAPLFENRFSGSTLCPDLVVPKGCECNLFVPVASFRRGRISIFDPAGTAVLRIEPQSGPGVSQDFIPREEARSPRQFTITVNRHLKLTTADGDLLAQACVTTSKALTPGHGVNTEFDMFRADGSYYATLHSTESASYRLTTPDSNILIWGSFDYHAVNIADNVGRLLGTTELTSAKFDPAGEYFCLRAAPLADVGLILCSLVCILQAKQI